MMLPRTSPTRLMLLAGLLVCVGLAGCKGADASREAGAVAASSEMEAILAQSRRLSDAYVQGDIEALVNIYTPDGVAIPGGRDYVRGRTALLQLWTLPEGRTILRHSATPVELEVEGDRAYDWGYYEGQAAQNGTPRDPFRGTYVIVWQRGADGTWRIAVDMWSRLN